MAKGSRAKPKDNEEEDTAPDSGKKDIKGALKALEDEGWEDTEEKSFSEVPEGKYQAKIEGAMLNHSKSSSRFQCSWTFTILTGPQKNRKCFKHDGLDTEEGRSFFRGTLAKLGVEWPKKASELPDVLEELLDSNCEITVKKKDEYTNVYINKALDEIAADDDEDDEEEVEEVEEKPTKKGKVKVEDPDDEDEDEVEEKPKKEEPDEEDDDDEEEEPEEPEEPEDEGVTTKFDDSTLQKSDKKAIDALATKHKFSTEDYGSKTDLLADVAEGLGISGTFKMAKELIAACEKAKPKK